MVQVLSSVPALFIFFWLGLLARCSGSSSTIIAPTTTARRGLAITTPLLSDGTMTAEMTVINNDRLQVKVTYQGESYVALAFSLDDQMPDSIGVIGTPSDGTVKKYDLVARATPSALPDAQQTLEDVSVKYDGTITTMQFTKLLKETNEPEIVLNQNNFFLYAHGNDGTTNLHFHAKYGAVTVNLPSTTATTPVAPAPPTWGYNTTPKTSPPTKAPSKAPTTKSLVASGSTTTDLGNGRFQLETPLLADDSLTAVIITDSTQETIEFTVTYQGESYVAVAFSLDSQMPDSIGVIGTPSDNTVKKYDLFGRTTPTVLPEAQQTLQDVSINYDGIVTTLKFTKLLKEANEPEIFLEQNNFFLYAHGNDGTTNLQFHAKFGHVEINFATGELAASDPNENKALWALHGLCMAIAWLLLLPMGIAFSVGRAIIPIKAGLWFQWHRGLNMLGVLLTIIGFAIAVSLIAKEQGDTAEHFSTLRHHKIGLAVFIFSNINALWGIFRPHAPHAIVPPLKEVEVEEAAVDDDDYKDHDEAEVTDYDDHVPKTKDKTATPPHTSSTVAAASATTHSEKTMARVVFEYGHRIVGVTAIVLAWFNVSSGAELFSDKYDGVSDLSVAAWIVVAIVAISTLGLGVAGRIKTKAS